MCALNELGSVAKAKESWHVLQTRRANAALVLLNASIIMSHISGSHKEGQTWRTTWLVPALFSVSTIAAVGSPWLAKDSQQLIGSRLPLSSSRKIDYRYEDLRPQNSVA